MHTLTRPFAAEAIFMENLEMGLRHLKDENLRQAIDRSLRENSAALQTIFSFWERLPEAPLSAAQRCVFFNSWKATHLKMLPIYGLSCRIQRKGMELEGEKRLQYLESGALNAETSYEDLGLDFDGHTHAELYDAMVGGFIPELDEPDYWTLKKFTAPKAAAFKQWIFRNMVVRNIELGLATNMFSEIFNHAEYSMASVSMRAYLDQHTSLAEEQKTEMLTYVVAHIEDETEVDHFNVVVEAMHKFQNAENLELDYDAISGVFSDYLLRVSAAMEEIGQMMKAHA